MWYSEGIKVFLREEKVDENIFDEIVRRMEKVADINGLFSGGLLNEVMGDEKLVNDFKMAYELEPFKYLPKNL